VVSTRSRHSLLRRHATDHPGAAALRRAPAVARVARGCLARREAADAAPPIDGDEFAVVAALPGAQVDVFTHPDAGPIDFLGSGDVDPVTRAVPLKRKLTTRDRLFAIQTLCPSSDRDVPLTPVLADERVFAAPTPITKVSRQNNPKPLVCDQARLVCRQDGSWVFEAALHNEETEADVSCILSVPLSHVSSNGVRFGNTVERAFSAAGNGPITKVGMRAQGIPPQTSIRDAGVFGAFRGSHFWAGIMAATAQWDLVPAWRTYAPPPDAPDGPESGRTLRKSEDEP
jgi:hypothetical protein